MSPSKRVICAISITVTGCQDSAPTNSPFGVNTSNDGGDTEVNEIQPQGSSVLVLVEDLDGVPVAGAAITPTPHETDPDPEGAVPGEPRSLKRQQAVLTNSEGLALLEGLPWGNFTYKITRDGYSSAVGRAWIPEDEDVQRLHRVQLQPVHLQKFQAREGTVVEFQGARVTIPPHALVYESGHAMRVHPVTGKNVGRDLTGQPVEGEVVAELAVVDPYTTDPRALPGPMLGVSAPGEPEVPLISAGMIEFRMTSDGFPVQPAPGAFAELNLRVDTLPTDIQAEVLTRKAIDKWYLDPVDGTWIHDGKWILTSDPMGAPILYGLQSHFSWINADIPCTGITPCFQCHILQVLSPEGEGIENLPVTIQGDPWHKGETGKEGKICTELPKGLPITLSVCGKVKTLSSDPNKPIVACADSQNWWLGLHDKATSEDQCTIDEIHCSDDPVCNPNSWRYCTDDLMDLQEQGICTEGKQFCVDGLWSACGDAVLPQQEVCGGNPALDESCDGILDENCGCDPNNEPPQDCYNGPLEELEHGCAPGKQVCDINNVWGKCDAVGPMPEVCGNNLDENCDGVTDCFGGAEWGRSVDQADFDVRGKALALNADSSILYVGLEVTRKSNQMVLNVGDGNLVSIPDPVGDSASVLVAYDTATGVVQWATALTGTGDQKIGDVAVIEGTVNNNPVTEVYVVGTTKGDLPVVVGHPMCVAAVPLNGGTNIFMAKFSGSGQYLKHAGLTEASTIKDLPRLAFIGSGVDREALVVAAFEDTIPPMDMCLQAASAGGLVDGIVMRVRGGLQKGDTGTCLERYLIRSGHDATEEFPQAIAVAPDGSVGIAGRALGGTWKGILNGQDGFVRRILLNGQILDWANPQDTVTPYPGDQSFTTIGFRQSGALVVGGHTKGTAQLGTCSGFDAANTDGFVSYDLLNGGACGRLTGANDQHIRDLGLWEGPPAADVLFAATTLGNGDINLYSPAPAGTPILGNLLDGVAGRFNIAAGAPWLQRFPRGLDQNGLGDEPANLMSDQTPWRLVVSNTGAVLITGWYEGGIGIPNGQSPLNLTGDNARESAFVVRLYP